MDAEYLESQVPSFMAINRNSWIESYTLPEVAWSCKRLKKKKPEVSSTCLSFHWLRSPGGRVSTNGHQYHQQAQFLWWWHQYQIPSRKRSMFSKLERHFSLVISYFQISIEFVPSCQPEYSLGATRISAGFQE